MNFVKANLVPLICGAVVLLLCIALWWPISFVRADVISRAADRANMINTAKTLKVHVEIPGMAPFQSVPTQDIIRARKQAQAEMKKESDKIADLAAMDNRRNRVVDENKQVIPLLDGRPQPYLLPKIDKVHSNLIGFRRQYNDAIQHLSQNLTGGTAQTLAVTPPEMGALVQQYQNNLKGLGNGGSALFPAAAVKGNAPANQQAAALAENEFIREQVLAVAKNHRIYVDPNALQYRAWAGTNSVPDETQIFNALADCWIESDIVNAINAANGKSTSVDTSLIKRLESVTIGAGDASSGTLFVTEAQTGGTAPAAGAAATPGIDLTRTMTGRVGGGTAKYDVVPVVITLDLDPAGQNRFIDELYRQNNGYTVLNISTTAVDPYVAASQGYLYGNTQVVQEVITVEALFFRNWTLPIMPDAIRTSVGAPAATLASGR